MAYINFIKASWPIICLQSYLYFSLITVQIQWLLCLNHIHKSFVNKKVLFPYFPFLSSELRHLYVFTFPSVFWQDHTIDFTPVQGLYKSYISHGTVLLPVFVFPLKHILCSVFLCSVNRRGVGCWADTFFQSREDTQKTKTCKEYPADRGLGTSLPP